MRRGFVWWLGTRPFWQGIPIAWIAVLYPTAYAVEGIGAYDMSNADAGAEPLQVATAIIGVLFWLWARMSWTRQFRRQLASEGIGLDEFFASGMTIRRPALLSLPLLMWQCHVEDRDAGRRPPAVG